MLVILSPLDGIGNCLYVAAAHGYKEAAEAIVAKARNMDNMLVAKSVAAGILQALINNDKGECNYLTKLAEYYGHNDFSQWARAAGLPEPELYRSGISELDPEEIRGVEELEEEVECAAAGGVAQLRDAK